MGKATLASGAETESCGSIAGLAALLPLFLDLRAEGVYFMPSFLYSKANLVWHRQPDRLQWLTCLVAFSASSNDASLRLSQTSPTFATVIITAPQRWYLQLADSRKRLRPTNF
jgi:hypothetical protein